MNCRYKIKAGSTEIDDYSDGDTDIKMIIINQNNILYKETNRAAKVENELLIYDEGYHFTAKPLDESNPDSKTTICQIDNNDIGKCYFKEYENGKMNLYLFDESLGKWTLSQ